MITIVRYTPAEKDAWNDFVQISKNGTFLFNRNYMDYHSNRFEDYSFIIKKDEKIVALFPANIDDVTIHSHQGLTYGGFISNQNMTTPELIEIFDLLLDKLSQFGISKLIYKSIPRIYHQAPAEEDVYALFLKNASLVSCETLSIVEMANRIPIQARRRRGVKKAKRQNIIICESFAWVNFWEVLENNLREIHSAKPVHSLDEIKFLQGYFPANIRLFTAELNKRIVAGTVIYESPSVAHCQYIAASEIGRKSGALDLLFFELLENTFREKHYFNFGNSTENQGQTLNKGLIDFKEGFGARTSVHNVFELLLDRQPIG
jgi:hypothetical protein